MDLGDIGDKVIFFGSFFVILGVIDLWVQIYWPRYVRLRWKFTKIPIFVRGIRKKWSRVDLLTPQILRLWRSSIFEDRSDPDPFKNQPIDHRSDPIRSETIFLSAWINLFRLLNYGLSDRFFCILERKTANSLNLIETRVEKNELIINTPIKIKEGVDKNIICSIFLWLVYWVA